MARTRRGPPRLPTTPLRWMPRWSKTQAAAAALSTDVLTNPSGFAGIDGVFRFRRDGTNQRGLAVLRVTPTGGEIIAPPPRTFGPSAI